MTIKYSFPKYLQFGFAGLLGCFSVSLFSAKAQAQQSNIIPDNTLGAESSQIISNFQGQPIEVITGGAIRQINQFHSFREFNISAGRQAYFFIPNADIQNVFARVTGNNRSEILGILGTFGNSNPNLFLINPNGILFGNNASLNVQGSFVGTTANGVQFGNQGNFSATNPEPVPLLTINPSALFFNQINKNAAIQNYGALEVVEGRSLLLVGGNVSIDGGILFAPGGRVELGGLAEAGSVGIQQNGNIFSLNFPTPVQRADVLLNNGAFIGVSSGGGGSVDINARNIDISGGSQIFAGIDEGLGTANSKAGDITLNATEKVKLEQRSFILNAVFDAGNGGDLTINTQDLLVQDGSQVEAITLAAGKAGNLTVNASNSVQLIGTSTVRRSGLSSFASEGSTGDVGDLTINTRNLILRDGAEVSVGTLGAGKAGNLTVNATGSVQIIGRSADGGRSSGLFASANKSSTGDAGNLTINTKDLLVRDGSEVIASTFSSGKGGNLTVNASDNVQLIGTSADGNFSTGLFAEATLDSNGDAASGNAGNLAITTKNLLVDNGAEISASTFGAGKGGDLTIAVENLLVQNGARVTATTNGAGKGGNLLVNASNSVQLIGTSIDGTLSGLGTVAGKASTGDAGDLTITTQDLLVRDGAAITTATSGTGKGGNLTVNAAAGKVELIGTSRDGTLPTIFSTSAQAGSRGNAGDLTINTQDLFVRDGAQISASTFSTGKAGNLVVNASNKVELIGTSTDGRFVSSLAASVQQGSTGNAGSLTINTQDLLVRDGARVFTGTLGAGTAGNLTVNASNKVELIGTSVNGSPGGLIASAEKGSIGDAGNLQVDSQNLIVRDGAQVLASTFSSGRGGNLTVNASESVQLIGQSTNSDFLSGLFASSEKGATGNAGNLTVNTQNLLARDGAQVIAATFGTGKAGNVTVNASENLQLIGKSANNEFSSGLFASAEPNSTGNAGDLTITTPNLLVRDGAGVFVNSRGKGNAGIMSINANSINLDNNASLNANTRSPNKDPNREQATINLNTQNLTLRHGSSITTNATGENVFGGNINIYTKFLIALENSRISANSDNSRGGRVVVNAQGVFVGTQPSDVSKYITATSGVGLPGTVEINTPDNSSIQNSFAQIFPVIDTNRLIAQSCIARANKKQENSFFITGSGALNPNRPGGSLSTYITGEVRGVETASRPWKKGDPIIEATGVYFLDNGQILLSRECSD